MYKILISLRFIKLIYRVKSMLAISALQRKSRKFSKIIAFPDSFWAFSPQHHLCQAPPPSSHTHTAKTSCVRGNKLEFHKYFSGKWVTPRWHRQGMKIFQTFVVWMKWFIPCQLSWQLSNMLVKLFLICFI